MFRHPSSRKSLFNSHLPSIIKSAFCLHSFPLGPLFVVIVSFVFLAASHGTAVALSKGGKKIRSEVSKKAPAEKAPATPKATVASLSQENERLREAIQRFSPKGVYAVVDTARNRLWLKNGEKVVYEAIVSTGSGTYLADPKNPVRKWVFETPRGEFSVKSKVRNPVWIKPDWAFIEEGEPIPADQRERVEAGVLGEYALAFGNGYFIHGTLYTRLLGQNVTHGCIRMADRDLEVVYKTLPIGARIYIL
ncbi:MAG: L,D-transpeptidase [Candidatus Manganitrophaceae bacterium]